MKSILDFFKHFGQDRKFVTTLLSIIFMMIGDIWGISQEILLSIGGVIMAFLFGQGFADIGKEQLLLRQKMLTNEPKKEQFYYSKKYWLMVLGIFSMGLAHYIDISQMVILEIGGLAIGYILSQGMADKGKSKEQVPSKLAA